MLTTLNIKIRQSIFEHRLPYTLGRPNTKVIYYNQIITYMTTQINSTFKYLNTPPGNMTVSFGM